MTNSRAPLSGVKVLDLTRFAAGPWATSLLADLGADVVKVEHPATGDGARHFDDVFGIGVSSYFVGLNRSKRSLALDLGAAHGRSALLRILERCDVVVENFRPGWMAAHGLGPQQLRSANPRLISCSLTPFGRRGPMADLPAMDIIAQAVGGVMGLTGERGRTPCRTGPPVADFTSSFCLVGAVLLGLYQRERTGHGIRIDTSLLGGQVALLANFLSGFAVTGRPDGPYGSGHPQLVPYQAFRAADGYIVIGCLTEEHWRKLCQALDRADLLVDPRFARNPDRVRHRDEAVAAVETVTSTRPCDHWMKLLTERGVPAAPVNTLGDLLASQQLWENGMLRTIETDDDPVVVVGSPFEIEGADTVAPRLAPLLGQHTQELLAEFGFAADEIAALEAGGTCAQSPTIERP